MQSVKVFFHTLTLGATLNTDNYLQNFNKNTFILCSTIIGLMIIPSFMAAWAEDDGNLTSKDSFGFLFARLFYILRFPTHTLLWNLIINLGGWAFFAGLAINCAFYGLLLERTISYLKKFRQKNNDD